VVGTRGASTSASQTASGSPRSPFTGPNGRPARKYLNARTAKDARAKLAGAQRALEDGRSIIGDKLTVGRYMGQWLEATRPKVRATTWHGYAAIVARHIDPAIGGIPLTRLTPVQVDAMLRELLDAGKAPRTVLQVRAILRRALGQAVRWGLVGRNVATLVDPPRVERFEISPLTPEEARAFLLHVHGDRLEALYLAAIATGLRQGELFGLRWPDLDLKAGTLAVRHALQRLGGDVKLVEPKTTRSRRTLRLPASEAVALREHRRRQLEERIAAGPAWEGEAWDLVFANTIGGPLDSRNVMQRFQRTLAAAGLRRLRFHDLRHSAATLLLLQGVPARVVMEVL
jgi:integrase